MPPQRTVAVDSRSVPYRYPGLAPPSELTQPPKPKQTRHTHSADEWDSIREHVITYYIDQDKTVEELVGILKTDHNFAVGLRKLKDWMKAQDIVKNESKRNMQVLYAKRQHRLIFEGKQTIISKDGRAIDDARLDRWGNKFAADLDLINSVAAATPEQYSIATPRPTNLPDQFYASGNEALNELFIADKPVEMIFALVLDDVDVHEFSSHRHHIGVLGLRMISDKFDKDLRFLFKQGLFLARDLITVRLVPASHGTEYCVSLRPTPNARVPKVHFSYTGCTQSETQPYFESRTVAILRSSAKFMQLLQLSSTDRTKWQRDWYAMTLEEKSTSDSLCTTYFGSSSSFSSVMAYVHVMVLLESPDEPADTVLTRVSIGLDTRPVRACDICQRRVVSVDSINKNGAVKLNIPLQSTWQSNWEPENLWTFHGSETARWEDHVYALRGWFLKTTHRWGLEAESGDQEEKAKAWDPLDTDNVLAVFQPREVALPVGCCAYNHVNFVCQCTPGVDETFNPDPPDSSDTSWDPDDSCPAITEEVSVTFSEEDLFYINLGWQYET